MPYIQREKRAPIQSGERLPETPGELNFAICQLVDDYIVCILGDGHYLTYESVNEVVGALECAKLEVYRRLGGPLEDAKCRYNGDVFEAGKLSI